MKFDPESKYNYYAEQIAQVMAQQQLIFEEEVNEVEQFIRGCA